MSLTKGQRVDLTKNNPKLSRIVSGIGWTTFGAMDIDFSCFLLRSNGKVSGDEDLIFYSNPSGANGTVSILGQNKKAFQGKTDHEQVMVQLRQVPEDIVKVVFTLTIYNGELLNQNFSAVQDTYIRIMDDATGEILLQYDLGNSFTVENSIVVGEVYRHGEDWKFSAIGAGYSGGLAALCRSYGIEVKDSPTPDPTPAPAAQPTSSDPWNFKPSEERSASPTTQTQPIVNPINLTKIELKKRGDTINLQKKSGSLGEILVNLNWNQKKKSGWFSSSGVDLDLACLYELKDGQKGVVQALGESFGSLNRTPFISLDGDDRTGAVTTGENIRINGNQITEFKRILIFTFIYEGAANWAEADGVVTIKQSDGPDIIVRLDEHNNRKPMCAIAIIRNVNDQTFSIEKIVQYYSGHKEIDQAFHWGLRWVAGSK